MRLSAHSSITPLLLVALLAAGCGGDDAGAAAASGDGTPVAASAAAAEVGGGDRDGDMTVLVYMAADNDLEPYAIDDLAEMELAAGVPGLDIVVLVDRAMAYTDEPASVLGQFAGTRLLHIGEDGVEELESPQDMNMSDPATVSWFIEAGLGAYPSERAGFVVWDHGGGWVGAGVDDSWGGDLLDLAAIESGVAAGLGALGRGPLDLLGFDACLMATYEVAATMAPHARYLLASEELEPGMGWDWSALAEFEPAMGTEDLAGEILGHYAAATAAAGEGEAITLSLLDLSAVRVLDEALGSLADDMVADIDDVAPSVGAERAGTLGFGRNPDPSLDTHLVDLGDLVVALAEAEADLGGAAGSVLAALDAMVVDQVTGPATAAATGLSIYFPPTPDLASDDYQSIGAADTWTDFLFAYYTEGRGISEDELPQFLDEDKYGEGSFGATGLTLGGEFTDAAAENLAEVTMYYGVPNVDGSQVTFYGDENAPFDGSGTQATYDLTFLQLSDGEDTALAYSSLVTREDGSFSVASPLHYYSPEARESGAEPEDALLSVVVDRDGTVSDRRLYGIDDAGATGELVPDPSGLLVPVVAVQSMEDFSMEWLESTDVGLWSDLDALQLEYVELDPGTGIFMELELTDFGGNHDYLFYGDAIPFG